MNELSKLADQNILVWESHLRHIDELMERARKMRADAPAVSQVDERLIPFKQDRDRLAKVLDDIRGKPFDAWPEELKHGAGLKGALETVGGQLEKVLATMFEQDKP